MAAPWLHPEGRSLMSRCTPLGRPSHSFTSLRACRHPRRCIRSQRPPRRRSMTSIGLALPCHPRCGTRMSSGPTRSVHERHAALPARASSHRGRGTQHRGWLCSLLHPSAPRRQAIPHRTQQGLLSGGRCAWAFDPAPLPHSVWRRCCCCRWWSSRTRDAFALHHRTATSAAPATQACSLGGCCPLLWPCFCSQSRSPPACA